MLPPTSQNLRNKYNTRPSFVDVKNKSYFQFSCLLLVFNLPLLQCFVSGADCWTSTNNFSKRTLVLHFLTTQAVVAIPPPPCSLSAVVSLTLRGGHQQLSSSSLMSLQPLDHENNWVVGEGATYIDVCDNPVQQEILLRHYQHEAFHDIEAFLQDYTANSVVHQVIDGTASTYHGVEGGRKLLERILGDPTTGTSLCRRHVQHVSIQSNRAKVEWKRQIASTNIVDPQSTKKNDPIVLVGTDWYTFDDWNHIATQTTVALSQQQ